ncbi:MAG: tRNA (guanosine(37)-N1)-methyltransferase TrmD [Tepidisphaeraceae bacterium]
MRIDVLTLFPEMFGSFLGASIPKRAAEKGLVTYHLTNIRDFATDAHKSVDDKPFGGGPGMVMMCPVLFDAVEAVEKEDATPATRVLLTPSGKKFDQAVARELAVSPRLLLIAGRYEGFDERISLGLNPLELSIGDYILSGGELAAMVVIDAVVRLLPGAIGAVGGAEDESFSHFDDPDAKSSLGLLEHPQFTRPREFRGMEVPPVLLGGDHKSIARWRQEQRVERTRNRRPDLWQSRQQPPADKE